MGKEGQHMGFDEMERMQRESSEVMSQKEADKLVGKVGYILDALPPERLEKIHTEAEQERQRRIVELKTDLNIPEVKTEEVASGGSLPEAERQRLNKEAVENNKKTELPRVNNLDPETEAAMRESLAVLKQIKDTPKAVRPSEEMASFDRAEELAKFDRPSEILENAKTMKKDGVPVGEVPEAASTVEREFEIKPDLEYEKSREGKLRKIVNWDVVGQIEMAIRHHFGIAGDEILKSGPQKWPEDRYTYDQVSAVTRDWGLGTTPDTPERALIFLRALDRQRRQGVTEKYSKDYDLFRGRGYKEGSVVRAPAIDVRVGVEDGWQVSEIRDLTREVVVHKFDPMQRIDVKKTIPLEKLAELNR